MAGLQDGERRWLTSLPALDVAVITVADLALGRVVVSGLLSTAPLLAASLCSPRLTAAYGGLAWALAALLGLPSGVYDGGADSFAQGLRLFVIAVMTLVSVELARHRVERERKLSQVTKIAEVAQRAILPPVPARVDAAQVAVHYESAAQEALIGGDLYGVTQTRWGLRVMVGDVRGKGLDAVRMSAQVLAAFRDRADDDKDLLVLLDHLDRTVERCVDDAEDFVTAVLAQIGNDGHLTVVNAGHPYPLAVSRGRVSLITPSAPRPPLGLGGPTGLDTVTLGIGDRLLLHTDGLTEARAGACGGFFPTGAVAEILTAEADVGVALGKVAAAAVAWSGGALSDDLAMVLVEYTG